MSRDDEAQSSADQTRLDVAMPKLSATEPVTQILHRSAFPSPAALDAAARPTMASSYPHDAISPSSGQRKMPFVLALLLATMCIAAAATLLRPRSRDSQPGSEPPAADHRTAPSHDTPDRADVEQSPGSAVLRP